MGVQIDLPRNSNSVALIGDPRNDENAIVSQIQLAFIKLHNRILEVIAGGTKADEEQFQTAQRLVRWIYQYVVWNDFVKRIVADALHQEVLKKDDGVYGYHGRFYSWKQAPFIPVEFSVAAYRFGHSMVRPGYQTNNPFLGFGVEKPIFKNTPGQLDLKGGRRLIKENIVQWDWFVQLPSSSGPFPQLSRKIDTKLSASVFKVPAGPGGGSNPLAFLNLIRAWRMEVPSGTAVAKVMGLTPHVINTQAEDALWHYVLKEAQDLIGINAGTMLGKVGGRIVAEVFAGLLYGDPLSFISCDPAWTPLEVANLLGDTGPINGGDWEFADIIHLSGMPKDDADVQAIVQP